MLQGDAQHHGSVAGCALDVLPGLAAVDENLARRPVWVETHGNGEVLTPKPQVEGFAGTTLREGFDASCGLCRTGTVKCNARGSVVCGLGVGHGTALQCRFDDVEVANHSRCTAESQSRSQPARR